MMTPQPVDNWDNDIFVRTCKAYEDMSLTVLLALHFTLLERFGLEVPAAHSREVPSDQRCRL